MISDAEALGDQALQVDPAPAHHAMHGAVGTGLDQIGEFGLLLGREPRNGAVRPVVLQPIRPMLVEAMHPVAQRLTVHAADPRRLCPVHAVQNRG